ncbi:MAG: heterodisulfide reductase-related iron-sulfur binding cluster [bacterium]
MYLLSFLLSAGASGNAVSRPTFWLIGHTGEQVFYALATLTMIVFGYGLYRKFSVYLRGARDRIPRLNNIPGRIKDSFSTMSSHSNLTYQDMFSGLMHFGIMWGFIVLFIATTILFIDMDVVQTIFGATFMEGNFYLVYSFMTDGFGLLFPIGVTMALYARYGAHKERLWHKHTSLEDDILIWLFFVLAVGGYFQEGLRILGQDFPSHEIVSFVGWFTADVLYAFGMDAQLAQAIYPTAWWSHALLALAFVAWLPFAKPFHMISSLLNIILRDEKAGKRLQGVPEDASPDEIGYTSMQDLSWKQLLDLDACTKCGRCTDVCPANASGRPLDPRNVILDLKEYQDHVKNGGDEIPVISASGESIIDAETMEACLSCMACMDACPVAIEHVPQFTEMNRRLVESGEMDENIQETMMDIYQNGNSFGDPERKRVQWAEELDFELTDAREESVEYLWYVGDYPSYDDRQQKVARSLATIFEESDVDFGVMMEDEQNDGNDVRRVGEEGLYEMLVEENIDNFENCEFDKIVCTDPHSFNTFKHEYPEFGWEEKPVFHYSQVLEELKNNGDLPLSGNELDYVVTYHDPCHLGRFNEVYEAPREMIRATGCELYEMPRNKSNSFCCGGGGGGLWVDADEEVKPSEERMREALNDTDAGSAVEKFVVACPMCGTMYEDGRKTGGYEDDIEVIDIAELVIEALNAPESEPAPTKRSAPVT